MSGTALDPKKFSGWGNTPLLLRREGEVMAASLLAGEGDEREPAMERMRVRESALVVNDRKRSVRNWFSDGVVDVLAMRPSATRGRCARFSISTAPAARCTV